MDENEEKTEVIPVTLPLDVWGILALKADDADMTLNDYVLEIVMEEVVYVIGMTMTSEQWLTYHPEYKGVTVIDPDGWDRKNFEESWAEEITFEEFERRMLRSTSVKKS